MAVVAVGVDEGQRRILVDVGTKREWDIAETVGRGQVWWAEGKVGRM